VVLESVEVLVALAANFATIRLLLFHSNRAWIGNGCGWVNDGERAVRVLFQLLVLVAVLEYTVSMFSVRGRDMTDLLVILETVLILVCLLTSNDRTFERLYLFVAEAGGSHALRQLCAHTAVTTTKLRSPDPTETLLAKQTLCWLVDSACRVPS